MRERFREIASADRAAEVCRLASRHDFHNLVSQSCRLWFCWWVSLRRSWTSEPSRPPTRLSVGGLGIDRVTESEVVDRVENGWRDGQGGVIVTPNVDIWRMCRKDNECKRLVDSAAIVVADGAPLLWAATLAGDPLPERVTGSGLVETLSAAAARADRSIYVVGGGEGDTCLRAARALSHRYPGLRIAGAVAPPFGFDVDAEMLARVVEEAATSGADLFLVGLGFPKQDRLAALIAHRCPSAWALGCGGGIAMAAGDAKRSPGWVQRSGVEWVVRLVQEPRRLARRYLVDDVPAAVKLLAMSARTRVRRNRGE